jgi:murein DD-endopeptidase MepM/ murein hydrolase activator NlpD
LPFFISLLAVLPLPALGEESPSPFPLINSLDGGDAIFKQFLSDVELARRRLFPRGEPGNIVESLTIFRYIPREGEDLLGLAARCAIPYGALAGLNRLSNPGDLVPGEALLLPSVPGLFVSEKPRSDFERLLHAARKDREGILLAVERGGKKEEFRFYPGDDLSLTERTFFLNRGFQFPLGNFVLTSPFGPRINPVTGRPGLHRGMDLGAPEGTAVHAAREGVVAEIGEDPVYGKYVIISHKEEWVSLYGHLQTIETTLHEYVQPVSLIGRVGSTGQSTGPHLHFEIRRNGRALDPKKQLRIFQGLPGGISEPSR